MIGILADDLTGAGEIGAVGWRYGLRSELVSSGPISDEADLVCVDADTRSVSAEEAQVKVVEACALLQKAGAEWIYKKVDSVLRGHVVVELQALLEPLDCTSALLVPANPERGRTLREGQYYISGRPINETEFSRDPAHPCSSARVMELLGGLPSDAVEIHEVGSERRFSGIVVGEAESTEDLQSWAGRQAPGVLMAGAAEFFEELLKAGGAELAPTNRDHSSSADAGREILVCGTVSESAREFIETVRQQGTPVLSLPGVEMDAAEVDPFIERALAEVRSNPHVAFTTSETCVSDSHVSRTLAQELTRVVAAVIRRARVSQVHVEGGATAAHFLKEMGWQRLSVTRELAPGVVVLGTGDAQCPSLTMKPGSYVWPEGIQERWRSGVGSPAPHGQAPGATVRDALY